MSGDNNHLHVSAHSKYVLDIGTLIRIIFVTGFFFSVLIGVFMGSSRFKKYLLLEKLRQQFKSQRNPIIGFFHPQCDGGAGGEKVLYQAIQAIQIDNKFKNCQVMIYSGSQLNPEQILAAVESRFAIKINRENLSFVNLQLSNKLKPDNYPRFTILFQALASIQVCFEAMSLAPCDIFIDTMGVGYAYPFIKLFFGPKIISYTHYPIVSYDMLNTVGSNTAQYNNSQAIASSKFKSSIKKAYYYLLIVLYKVAGYFIDQIATNSSWTNNHILHVWNAPKKTQIIYPPIDTREFSVLDLNQGRQNIMVSMAQFRPEKEHDLQIKIWAKALYQLPPGSKFYMIGTVRDEDDQRIVLQLQDLTQSLGVQDSVKFEINQPRSVVISIFENAKVAVHTMKFEHFGIAVCELMAAGIVTIAHNSAGPKEDIIGANENQVGYLAESEDDYVKFVQLGMNNFEKLGNLRKNAREWVNSRFSKEQFNAQFIEMLECCV